MDSRVTRRQKNDELVNVELMSLKVLGEFRQVSSDWGLRLWLLLVRGERYRV